MKGKLLAVTLVLVSILGISQTKVAILDFENTSGISKYDGFGKALSNMLITDLKNSIHPRKITFLERSQLNKILSEQNLQKSKNFDKSTAVSFGKLAGVKYVLVGSVYVMDGTCNITSRLVDVQTSEIVHAKESNGKITNWLSLKSVLANELSTAMNSPVTIEAEYSEKETSEGVLTQYAKVIDKMDQGDMEGAQEMTEMLSSVQPDFKYFDELKLDIEELKKQVKENTEDIKDIKSEVVENVTDYLSLGNKYELENDFKNAEKYYLIGYGKVNKINIVSNLKYINALAQFYYRNSNYVETIRYANLGLSIYPYFKEFLNLKYLSFGKLNKIDFNNIIEVSKIMDTMRGDILIMSYLEKYAVSNNTQIEIIEEYLSWKQWPDQLKIDEIKFSNYGAYFNENSNMPFNEIAMGCIQEIYNDKPEIAYKLLKELDLSNTSDDILFAIAWYSLLSGDFVYAKPKWGKIVLNYIWKVGDCADYGFTKMVKPPNKLKNSVIRIHYVFDKSNEVLKKDTIREYHPSGTVRKYPVSENNRDNIELKKPYWYYEYADGRGFVTTNPIEAFIFKSNQKYPLNSILDCIESSGFLNWSNFSEIKKMAIINWGHSYFLSKELDNAFKIYNLFDKNYKFGKEWNYIKFTEILKSDWSEFQEKGLIDKSTIEKVISELGI